MIFDRLAIEEIRVRAERCCVLIVMGGHGTGKSVAVRTAIAGHRHLDLEDQGVYAEMGADVMGFLRRLDGPTVIDHAERLPEIFDALPSYVGLRDEVSPLVVVSAVNPGERVGSAIDAMDGLELMDVGALQVDDIHPAKPTEGWRNLWLRGGIPAAYLGNFRSWHERNLQRIAEEISAAGGRAYGAREVLGLMHVLAGMQGQGVSLKRTADLACIDRIQVVRILEALSDRFVVRLMQRVRPSAEDASLRSPVLYFRDTGMLHALCGIGSEEELERHPLRQASWASFVLEAIFGVARPVAPGGESLLFFSERGDGMVPVAIQAEDARVACFPFAGMADRAFLENCRRRARESGCHGYGIVDFKAMTWGKLGKQIAIADLDTGYEDAALPAPARLLRRAGSPRPGAAMKSAAFRAT